MCWAKLNSTCFLEVKHLDHIWIINILFVWLHMWCEWIVRAAQSGNEGPVDVAVTVRLEDVNPFIFIIEFFI